MDKPLQSEVVQVPDLLSSYKRMKKREDIGMGEVPTGSTRSYENLSLPLFFAERPSSVISPAPRLFHQPTLFPVSA